MTLKNVRVQIFVVPAMNGFHKVSVVTLAALEIFDSLPLLVASDRAAIIRHHDVTAFAVNDDANPSQLGNFQLFDYINASSQQIVDALLGFALLGLAGRKAADFENEWRFRIIVENDLRIWRGPVIDITQSPA